MSLLERLIVSAVAAWYGLLADDTAPGAVLEDLWIVQLTPATASDLPTTADQIDERTQQLVENLSLSHDRQFVETVNEWVADGQAEAHTFLETLEKTALDRDQSSPST